MSIYAINIDDTDTWDKAVKRLPNYDVFYLNGYLKAFQLHGDGCPQLIVYENGEDYAVNAVFVRDIAVDTYFAKRIEKNKFYDLSTPYGYGGFIGHVRNYTELSQEWKQYCVQKGYVCEFVRFELFSDYRLAYGGKAEAKMHNVVRSLELPIDEMWMDFKQKVRKNVKRARKYNLEIMVDNEGKYFNDFIDIYDRTMSRNHAEDTYYFSKTFFEELMSMKDNIMFFHARYGDKIISTEMVIYGAKNCYSFLGGTDSDYFDMRPNDFLKYEIIKWAKEKGLENFVLGGGYGKDDGIFQYKACLAPNGIVDFYIGKNIFDKEKYEWLIDMKAEYDPACRTSDYFPQYRV